VDHPELMCSFGTSVTSANFVNESVVKCTAPAEKAGTVDVFLSISNKPFTVNQLQLVCSGASNSGLGAGGVAGLVVGLVGFAALLSIGVFFFYRAKYAKKKLKEPDYVAIAFSGGIGEYDISKDREDGLNDLEKVSIEDTRTSYSNLQTLVNHKQRFPACGCCYTQHTIFRC
jgi:hypothetical protein